MPRHNGNTSRYSRAHRRRMAARIRALHAPKHPEREWWQKSANTWRTAPPQTGRWSTDR